MDVGVWVAVAGAVVAVVAAYIAWRGAGAAETEAEEARKQTGLAETAAQESARQTVAAQRSATAAEDSNRLAAEHVTLVPDHIGGDEYALLNTGNVTATDVWLRRRHSEGVDLWRSEPVTVLASGGMSPTFTAQHQHWPVGVVLAERPGWLELAKPPTGIASPVIVEAYTEDDDYHDEHHWEA